MSRDSRPLEGRGTQTKLIGQTLGHFEISAKLGEGGMGEVYRAEDTKLGREVAIKLLPAAFTADAERLERFAREARVLASLNHRRIAAIYEVGEAEGPVHYLVMELAPGETLAERIGRAAVPVEDALDLARQIAEGLEAAHEQGIIHRDLKPSNVKVTADGQVKILDFGLAKALEEPPGAAPDLSMSPTLTARLTGAQTLLGTAGYMSPEQARGKPVDRRADIWAFGVLLVEMLTGECPFGGETISDSLAAVLTREVDLRALPAGTPAHVRWLISRCLERDPGLRLRDVGEARVLLATGAFPAGGFPTSPTDQTERPRGRRRVLMTVLTAAVAAAAGLGLGLRMAADPPSAGPRKFDIALPKHPSYFRAQPLISPDGSAIVMASEAGLVVRHLDRVENQLLPGTADTLYSAWAPGGREVGFVTLGRLWRVALDGQSPVRIATLPEELAGAGGMVWTRDDRILLAGSPTVGLLEVSANGGTVRDAVPLDPGTERDFHEITELPDDRGFLVSVHPQGGIPNRIDVLSGGKRETVLEVADGWVERPAYSPPGYVLFSKGTGSQPELWAVPFSLARLEATGAPFLVAPSGAAPSVADDGTLIYVRGRRVVLRQALELDREGRIERELAPPVTGALYPDLSPDGRRLVMGALDAETYDLLVYDVATRTATKLTSGPGVDLTPAWSPDGRRIAYTIDDQDSLAIVDADRPGEPVRLTTGHSPRWLPDGESLVFERLAAGASWDVWRRWLAEERDEPLLDGPANERWPIPSPDSRWLAYTSDETGREEVFVRAFPSGDKIQVSRRGATEPKWTASGDLILRSGAELYLARRAGGDRLAFDELKLLLSLAEAGLGAAVGDFSTTPDGGLVALRDVVPEGAAILTVVTDWAAEFREGQ